MSTKPRLGQHFLNNKDAVHKIITALHVQANETIIEIGPGKGALTIPLVRECKKKGAQLIAIEKDASLIEELTQKLETNNSKLEIIEGDALKLLPHLITNPQLQITNYKVVGNIPYYISGKLFRILSELPIKPTRAVFMVQREVALRITASPPRMNLLSAALGIWFNSKIITSLKPADFTPPPKVDSAIILLETNNRTFSETKTDNYYSFIKILFKQPRKTILNNIAEGFPDHTKGAIVKILMTVNLTGGERPENLSLPIIEQLVSCF